MPITFKVGELVRLKELKGVDSLWNGEYAIVLSNLYYHTEAGYEVIDITIANHKWAVQPYNLDKTYEEEYDAYVEEKYLNPKESEWKEYDGRTLVKWSECVWQPKELKKENE